MPKEPKSGVQSPMESGMRGLPPGMPGRPVAKKGDKESSPSESSGTKEMHPEGGSSGGKLPAWANE